MPLLAKDYETEPCPDARILAAVADGVAPHEVRYAVEMHAAGCAGCADLMRRVGEFQPFEPGGARREWRQVQKRLDSRMQEFLGTELRNQRSTWWTLAWALAPIAAAAVVIFWIPKATAPSRIKTIEVEPIAHSRAAADKPSPGVVTPVDKTAAITAVPAPRAAAALGPKTPDSGREVVETSPASSIEPEARKAQTAVEPAPAHSAAPAFAPITTTAAGQPGQPEPSAAPSPAYIHINAGTRVWILLQSTSPATNGAFTFRGMVLLPVTQGGAILLDRETRVVGTGMVNQGRNTIRITEFVWHGIRDRLRGSLEGRPSGPGTGPAVQFSAGQVLETWLAFPSIYEQAVGSPAPQ
jgi:hypothetical protein